jgi:hypothetical protein
VTSTKSTSSQAAVLARAARVVADLLRLAFLVSGVVVIVLLGGSGSVAVFVVFAALLVPRWAKIAAPFDMALCATLLVACWARQQHWYATVPWADEVVHFFTPGTVAVAAYLVLCKVELLPDGREVLEAAKNASLALLVTCLGLAVATVWELFEWVANEFAPKQTLVGYTDTISDLALGGLGALLAGLALTLWLRLRSTGGRGLTAMSDSR